MLFRATYTRLLASELLRTLWFSPHYRSTRMTGGFWEFELRGSHVLPTKPSPQPNFVKDQIIHNTQIILESTQWLGV